MSKISVPHHDNWLEVPQLTEQTPLNNSSIPTLTCYTMHILIGQRLKIEIELRSLISELNYFITALFSMGLFANQTHEKLKTFYE